jgi:hypothetical protein
VSHGHPPDTSPWDCRRGRIRTGLGQWFGGRDIKVRGRWLLAELLERLSITQLNVFNITGRVIEPALATWFEKTVFFTSYPDPRIWCNHLGAMAGNGGTSPAAAAAIGTLAADSRAYGSKLQYLTVRTLQQLYARRASGLDWAEALSDFPARNGIPDLPGFARPGRVTDERLEPLRKLTGQLGFSPGPYMQFVEELSNHLRHHHSLDMNAAAYACAFLLDQGFSADDVYRLRTSDVLGGVLACYTGWCEEPEDGFLPLRCGDVGYAGPSPRALPPL